MIAAFSTSSPQASVSLIGWDGEILAAGQEWAPTAASGACLRLLEQLLNEATVSLSNVEVFASDLGPGSFTGVKVGVTLAKTLAFATGKQTAGATSFDLMDPVGRVVLPSKRGEWFVRDPGAAPMRVDELPEGDYIGFGPGIDNPVYPHAMRFAALLDRLGSVPPELLVPSYLIDPSISIPKQPFKVLNQ